MKPIVIKIKTLSASERKITAEIIDCIREIDLLKIHLEMGYPSLMEFLVRECGYSETAALRRIDAARILNSIPEIREDLKSGSLNLSQVSIVAQSVRQKEKLGEKVSLDKKIEIVKAVKHKRTFEVQKIAAQLLELPIVQMEKLRVQADESVRIEMSLSKLEMAIVQRAKELLGHIKPGMSLKELVVLMAERTIKAKDPAREVRERRKAGDLCEGMTQNPMNEGVSNQMARGDGLQCSKVRTQKLICQESRKSDSVSEFKFVNPSNNERGQESKFLQAAIRAKESKQPQAISRVHQSKYSNMSKGVPAPVKRKLFQRDLGCQWIDLNSGKRCGSKHLLEMDHRISKWAGGSNEFENLELKCRAHNQLKYRKEAGITAKLTRNGSFLE